MRIRQKFEDSQVIEAAYLFYTAHKKQREIASIMHMTQPQVSQMIEQAREDGIIKISVQSSQEVKLARGIIEKYPHIKECIVLKYNANKTRDSNTLVTQLLGNAAAEHFNGHVLSGGIVGVSGGMTMASMVNSLNNKSNIENLSVYSMSIWCRSRIDAVSPVAIVSDIIKNFPGSIGFSAQVPGYDSDPQVALRQKQMDLQRIQPVLAGPLRKDKNKTLYVGLGSIPGELKEDQSRLPERPIVDFTNLLKELNITGSPLEAMAGECCLQAYDINGGILTSSTTNDAEIREALKKIENNVIGFNLEYLRDMVKAGTDIICAVAGGYYKQNSVLGGLRGKIFNHLITDITCAEYVLAASNI